MQYPTFYDKVEPIILKDELSNFLGATKDGIVEISYLDCVKLASHSCPTVASSFIATKVALEKLFRDTTPKRGEIKVEFSPSKEDGVTGVIGLVIGYICGASDNGGFSGIGGKFNKRNLLTFENREVQGLVKLTRLDTHNSITLDIDTSKVPSNPNMKILMQKSLMGSATKNEQEEFKKLWQSRVEYLLTKKDEWGNIVKIKEQK